MSLFKVFPLILAGWQAGWLAGCLGVEWGEGGQFDVWWVGEWVGKWTDGWVECVEWVDGLGVG